MASPTTAAPEVNGASPMPSPNSPSSIQSSTKRKRSESEHSATALDAAHENKPAINGSHKRRDQKSLIRDYLDVLRGYDTDVAVLKRPLPESHPDDEPQAKRQKSDETTTGTTIEDKFGRDEYNTLEDLVADITLVVKSQLTAPKSSESGSESGVSEVMSEEMMAKAVKLKDKAHELYRREFAYPQLNAPQPDKSRSMDEQDSKEPVSLMIYSNISTGRKPLLTSLQQRLGTKSKGEGVTATIADANLPNGIYLTQAAPTLSVDEKPSRSLTLGELFPSPRNLPPLQPHKPAKSTIKNNVLTFYHPELTNQSKFRTGTYFSQHLSSGQWLDYSNATPSSHMQTRQRQRAQSLAGLKPSSTELEMSEMEALFRGAFSSFAPCKDDTAAVVSSGQLSHMYWQQWGRRNLQRMIESDIPGDESVDDTRDLAVDIDEGLLQEVVDNWDDAAIDPTLSQVMGERSDQDKEVDDILEEVSDLIETLASYQRNRNLTLPTSQDRHSTDPPNGDMLRNGSLSHQPTEEEVMTYETLKSQLALIIKTLPPSAVARINSDKLEELNVSTKIQVRTNEYTGVMEEDEPAVRARQMAAQASGSGPRASHRTPSVSAGTPYANHQYNNQYASRTPMPSTPHFPQTPSRPQPNMYQRSSSAVPIPQPHQVQARPTPPQPYRTPSGYGGLAPQLAKSQTPYGHSNMPQYAGNVPGQARVQPHPGYANMGQATPNHRYAQGYPAGYPQQQQQQQQMHPQPHAQQRQYPPYMNGGASQIPQRTMSPQVPGQQPLAYSQSPTPPQQHQQINRPPYGTPTQGMPPNVRQYNSGSPGVPQQVQQQAVQYPGQQPGQQSGQQPGQQSGQQPGQQPGQHQGQHPGQHQGNRSVGITGYHTVMGDAQQQQVLEQARQQAQARHDAQARTIGYGPKVPQGEIAGLAGIGLSGNVDIQKLAAARANMTAAGHNNNNSMSPSPKPPVQPAQSPMSGGVNGAIAPPPPPPPAASPLSAQGSSASPAPVGAFNP